MSEKSEAMRLADAIDPFVRPFAPDHLTSKVAADELRRLHAEVERLRQIVEDFPPIEAELQEVSDRAHRLETQRDALLEVCKTLVHLRETEDWMETLHKAVNQARAAIKAVEGEKE